MKKAGKAKVAWRNRSPTGWWLFCEVEYWVSNRQKKLLPTSRCPVWENTRIIKAKNRDEAYAKAMRLGRRGRPVKTSGGEWRFAGISLLLPIYEDFEDEAEILWTKRGQLSVGRIGRIVKSKRQLLVFDDDEE
jgi:hypothetical protein